VNKPAIEDERGTERSTRPGRLRVVGCGNPYAGDDGAGLEIVRRLRENWDGSCELLDRPQAGLELLDCMQGADVILFVDAVSSGAPPGTLHLVPLPSPDLEARGLGALSSHGWGLTEALSLMSALEWQAPRLFLLGVEIETLAPDKPRSEAVEAAIQTVVDSFARLSALLLVLCFRKERHMDHRECHAERSEASSSLTADSCGETLRFAQGDKAISCASSFGGPTLDAPAHGTFAPRHFPPGDKSFPGGS